MKLHEYAIFDHSRANIGRLLGITSMILASSITALLAGLYAKTEIPLFAGASVTSAIVYTGLHWAFNKFGWKQKLFQLFWEVPDLNGVWQIVGKTLDENDNVVHNWFGTLDIEQKWEKISISLKTETSQSFSYTATITKVPGNHGGWLLHYSYDNKPFTGNYKELNGHSGYCEAFFNVNLDSANASYFNSRGRNTFGSMTITKVVENDK